MILIADSGATKTQWACVSPDGKKKTEFFSQGYNPNYISGPEIVADIRATMPAELEADAVREIYFYGAGVTPMQYGFMEETLRKVFGKADRVFIAMDTLASCRALLQRESGFAAIPGTLLCGWLSDKLFHGRRALPTILFMVLVLLFIVLYWMFIDNLTLVIISLIGIGFFIYGPVMLIGVQALDLAPKNAAGTAAGLTGFFGYFLGTFILANTIIGWVAQTAGWSWTFILLIAACILAILFMGLTLKEERK